MGSPGASALGESQFISLSQRASLSKQLLQKSDLDTVRIQRDLERNPQEKEGKKEGEKREKKRYGQEQNRSKQNRSD